MEIGDARSDGHDLAGGLVAGNERQAWRLVEPGAEIDVDEVEADGVLAYPHLARSGGCDFHILIHQGFRPSHLVHAHGLGHDNGSLGICSNNQRQKRSESHRRRVVNSPVEAG